MAIKMNKVATKSKRALRFDDLNRGDIFQGERGNWYIKTYDQYDDCGDLQGNTIRLDNGAPHLFDDDQNVTKLKKDLTVDYSNDDITEWYDED